jgi:haloalkane dehalogenase
MMNNHPWIAREAFPFGAHYLDVAAGKMHYVDEGNGEAVVMVHGNPTWSFIYRQQIGPLFACIFAL